MESKMSVDSYGNKIWRSNGQLHREDGPAVDYAHGTKIWYLNGKRHRIDGPAIETAHGYREWYINGEEVDEFTYWYLCGIKTLKDSGITT